MLERVSCFVHSVEEKERKKKIHVEEQNGVRGYYVFLFLIPFLSICVQNMQVSTHTHTCSHKG